MIAPKAFVFAGAGVAGVGYAGAVRALEEAGKGRADFYAGTSAGAIVAAALAVGHNAESISQLLRHDFTELIRDSGFEPFEAAHDIFSLINHGYLNSGKRLGEWLHDIFDDATMFDVPNLRIYACDAQRPDRLITIDSTTLPAQPLWRAVWASAAIPFFLARVDGMSDGGSRLNFPLAAWPMETLGFYIEPEPDPVGNTLVDDLKRHLNALLRASNKITELEQRRLYLENEAHTTVGMPFVERVAVELPRIVGTTEFSAPRERLHEQEQAGYDATTAWIAAQS